MTSTKAIEFIGSNEYFEIIKKIGDLFHIDWGDEKMPKIIALVNNILRYNQTAEMSVKELIKKWLDFLNEEEINNLYNFLNENFLPKVKELWSEEIIEEESEEPFEEREKRYLELMKTILKYPQKEKPVEKPVEKKKEEKKEIKEEYKTITFEPKEKPKKEISVEALSEGTIIITKKKEEEQKKEEKEFLDLSKL
jgi:hypothetical protein